ncbi:MAG: energy-coupling factor transporter transmembrane protein EcfT [Myxococcales bacterium]|nr:energy-coupling factor transporter transmembrane protein EcfT [Myxococcales bacterium]
MGRALSFFRPAASPPRRRGLHPATYLLTGLAMLAGCLLLDPVDPVGMAGILLTVGAAWFLFRPDAASWSRFALFGLAMFVPVFIFLPWVTVPVGTPSLLSASGFLSRLAVLWRIFARGLAILLVMSATVVSMTMSEFQTALAALPLPRLLVALTAQIVHHTGMLAAESRRIGQAMALRGGTTGWRASLLVVGSLPSAWLPRVVERADRVATALELRGYDGLPIDFDDRRFHRRDVVILWSAVCWVAAAILFRWKGISW